MPASRTIHSTSAMLLLLTAVIPVIAQQQQAVRNTDIRRPPGRVAVHPAAPAYVPPAQPASGKRGQQAVQGGGASTQAVSFSATQDNNDYRVITTYTRHMPCAFGGTGSLSIHDATYPPQTSANYYSTSFSYMTAYSDDGPHNVTFYPGPGSSMTYSYHQTYTDGASCNGSYDLTATGSTVALKPPVSVTASSATSDMYVTLNWSKGSDIPDYSGTTRVIRYYIYRNGVYFDQTENLTYTAGITPGQTDSWGVATNTNYAVIATSTIATASGSTAVFRAPLNVQATDTTFVGFVRITWSTNSDYATDFRIYRDNVLIATVPKTAQTSYTYDDKSITDAATYSYCVKSYNSVSNSESAGTCDNGAAYPILPNASDGLYTNRVKITWSKLSLKADEIKVYRDGDELGTVTSNANAYYDYDATPGCVHRYSVAPIKLGEEFGAATDYGFVTANGRIDGKVQTPTLAGIENVDVSAVPVNDTIRRAASFTGSGHVISGMAAVDTSVANTFTMELWVKPTATRAATTQSTSGTAGTSGQRYAIAPRNGDSDYGAGHAGAGVSVGTNGVSVFEHANSYLPSPLVYSGAIPAARWTHLAVVYENKTPRLYVDGALVATGVAGTKTVHPSALFGDVQSYGQYLGGIDEVRFWNYARTQQEIAADTARELHGDEPGLVAYWNFNRSTTDTTIVGDYAHGGGRHGHLFGAVLSTDIPDVRARALTDVDGYYVIRNAYYGTGTEFSIHPEKPRHGFKPDVKTRTLDIPNPSAVNVDFTDTTSFAVEGFVHFPSLPGQPDSCGVANVEILVNGKDRGVRTDSTGHFILSIEESGVYTITPQLLDHAFFPSSATVTVNDDLVGPDALHFRDTRTRQLSLRARGGSLRCDIPVGPAEVTISAFGTDTTNRYACYTFTDTTNVDGNLYLPLPAQRYRLTVRYLASTIPIGIGKEETRMWDMTADSIVAVTGSNPLHTDTIKTSVQDTLRFNYHPAPTVDVADFWDVCGPLKVLEQYQKYPVRITVTEQIVDRFGATQSCDLDTGLVFIYDEIKDNYTGPDTLFVKDGVAYVDVASRTEYALVAGQPNIYENATDPSLSYRKRFQAAAQSYANPAVLSAPVWAVVKGNKPRTQTFFTKTPELPILILRDPPGDQSSSFMEKGQSLVNSYSTSYEVGGGAGVFIEAKAGAGFTLPLVGKTGVDIHTIGKFEAGRENHNQTTTTVAWTATENWSTSDAVLGVAGGGGDVIMGASMNMTYALTDVVDVTNACTIARDTSLAWGTQGFNTTYIYTEDHIRNVLIPQLTMLKNLVASHPGQPAQDSAKIFQNYIDVWNQVLTKNAALKQSATFKRNISFSAGAPYTSTETTTTDSTISFDYTIYINAEVSLAIGAHSGDFNMVEGGVAANFRWTTGGQTDTTFSTATTVGYTLSDDDAGDFFSVDVKDDPVYKTPVFSIVAGTSSCPWEPGTQSRDGAFFPGSFYPKPLLAMDRYLATDILPDDKATFILNLTNTSESGETRDYLLEVNQITNLDGAIISVGGVNIENALKFTIPPGVTRKATLTVERGPVAYDYDNIEICLKSACDDNIVDCKSFSVHFLSPCSNATIVEPADNFLINQTNANTMHVILTDLEKDKIGDDLELQYRKVGTQKWNLAMLIPKNSIVDQKFKFFETDWAIPASVTDGTYEIRVKVRCTSVLGGGITYSNVVTGVINRSALQVFGVPEPRDGILNFGDEIAATFTNDIDCGAITKQNVSLMFLDDSTFIPPDSIQLDCKANTLIVLPMIALRRMQNRMLQCTVSGITDVNGNPLLSPVQWSFKVDQNALIWETANASTTTFLGTASSVTGTLKNVGGTMQTFTLSPTREWLTPITVTGTLPPVGSQKIIFMVSDKLNPGVYRDTVYAISADGDEPFYIEVRVLYKQPAWSVNPSAFQHNMEITCQYVVDTVYSTDPNDIIAAFVGDDCRGVANMQYVPSLGVYRAFLTVYGEGILQETVKFRAWQASTGKIYLMQETFPFDETASHGTLVNPVVFHPTATQLNLPLDQGWTWFSLNTVAPNMSPNAVFAHTQAAVGDLVKSQTAYSQFVLGSGWFGTIDTMRVGTAYKIKLANASGIEFAGSLVPPTLPIPVTSGWNWIGYLPTRTLPVNLALFSVNASAGDRLKGRNGFAEYGSGSLWQGSLSTMNPNQGYLLKLAAGDTIVYPDAGALWPGHRSGSVTASSTVAATPAWSVDPKRFEHTMNVTGALYVDGRLSGDGRDMIAAFVGDECRGIAAPIDVNGRATYFLTVYANTEGEPVTFRAYVASRDSVYMVVERLTFASDGVTGDPVSPQLLHVSTTQTGVAAGIPAEFALEQNYPNPFNPSTSIGFSLPHAGWVSLKVYDLLGNEVATLLDGRKDAGRHVVSFDAAGFRSGQYTYQLRAGGRVLTRRMVVLK